MQIEPPAMVNTTIAQQYQIDDGEYNLQNPDIEEVPSLEVHVVVTVDISCCWVGWESLSPWFSGMQKASWWTVAFW